MPRFIPRTIRGQLILGTALLQFLLVAAVFWYVYREQRITLRTRTAERLAYQVHLLSSTSALELRNQHLANVQSILEDMLDAPTIYATRITDLSGRTLAYSGRTAGANYPEISAAERQQVQQVRPFYGVRIFDNGNKGMVAVANVNVDGAPIALAWVYPDISEDEVDLSSLLRSALLFALLAIAANALFSMLLARSVTRPLRGLLRGTKLLIRDPERSGVFPLKTNSVNEAGELTRAFNTMVTALNEQRSGLNDTLALLDSMLANAPIGFAFFDRKTRYVRVNQFLAEMDTLPISRHLGRTVDEVFPGPMALELTAAIEQVFSTGAPVRDLELNVDLAAMLGNPRTWLTSLYPVRIEGGGAMPIQSGSEQAVNAVKGKPEDGAAPGQVRWVGAVIVDTTARKVSEEMLRRTEKLAATGRLAASIAHEINNPLEAVTNLLFLLRQQPLDSESLQYTDMAQREIARVSQITQQTLRFYRQASKPVLTSPAELLDSVLSLHQGRLYSAKVKVDRRYSPGAEVLAFSGEMRQLFSNLIGNALDAMPKGGRLILSVRPSRAWNQIENQPEISGVRIVVADTGSGMNLAVRRRIFDAFFTTKETTGTGLGLWISSEIIAKHQGTVRVRSCAAGDSRKSIPGSASLDSHTAKHGSGTVFMLFFPHDGDTTRAWTTEHGNQNLETQNEV
jgi:signal transduction histidine kinase